MLIARLNQALFAVLLRCLLTAPEETGGGAG